MPAGSDHDLYVRTITARAAKLDVSPDEKRLGGYAIVFNSLSQDLGGWFEVIAPSAVDRTLKAGSNVDALVDHERSTTTVLGSTDSGLLTLRKDRHGLKVDIRPPDTTAARDVITNVKAGLVRGMSFAFRLQRDPATGEALGVTWEEDSQGRIVRTIADMTFDDVSVVLNPAYLETEISARSMQFDTRALDEFKSARGWKPSIGLRERLVRAGLR